MQNITGQLSWILASFGSEIRIYLIISLVILILSFILKKIHQPYIIAYMLAGIVLGPYGMKMVTNIEQVQSVGEIGLIILMFFVGMEISLPKFLSKWRIAILGTGLQIIMSLLICIGLEFIFDWPMTQAIFFGFIIALSSSAVVIKYLHDKNKLDTSVGQNVLIILVTQDILFVPILILLANITGDGVPREQVIRQIAGGLLLLSIILYVLWKNEIKLPFAKQLEGDFELQVFAGLLLCFGMAFFTDFFGLSAALGAFVGGIVVHASTSTQWFHSSLHPFRVVLVSVFFISIGILIDLDYFLHNWKIVTALVLAVFTTNHGINMLSLKALGNNWWQSFYGGGLLAQIGELSFIIASVGRANGVLTGDHYNLTIITISVTIFLSPLWIGFSKKIISRYYPTDDFQDFLADQSS